MRPLTNPTHRTLLTLCLLIASVLAVRSLRGPERSVARDEGSAGINANRSGPVSVHAAGRGKPFLNLQDGRETSVVYRGDRDAAAVLQNRSAQSRSLASADFDHNGTPDVVAGYGYSGGGVITLQRGNPEAFAPADDAVFARLQQGYDPAPLLPWADVYRIPVSPDFLATGNFNSDTNQDILVAAKNGELYLLAGDGRGGLDAPQAISLPGTVTALTAGQFRAADLFTDVAVGVSGSDGHSLLIFDDAATGFTNAVVRQPLTEPASVIEFGGLDADPFLDVAVAEGREVLIVHGWGRKTQVTTESRVERIHVGAAVRGLALGEFAWDREGRSEIAALAADGVHILQHAKADTRPFTPAEAAERTRGKVRPVAIARAVDIESVPSWQRTPADRWRPSRWLPASDCEDDGEGGCEGAIYAAATPLLQKSKLSYRSMDDLMLIGGSRRAVEIVHPLGPADYALSGRSAAVDLPSAILDTDSAPVAVLALPRKLNGVTDVLMLNAASNAVSVMPAPPNTTITVDRVDDPAGAQLTAAAACTAAANDCSLRGAIQFANNPLNNNTTISLPANTYILSINGTSQGGCEGVTPGVDGNAVGDLGANQSMTITGAGAATTIIRQTGNGPANDGDRIMCMNEVFAIGLIYDFSGVSFVGGREGTAAGGGSVLGGAGIIGGELNNSLTLTSVVFANNQETVAGSANGGGGGLQITGGNLTIVNSTFGGSSVPGLYSDRSNTNTGNKQTGSGGGLAYTPSSPQHAGGSGTLTVTGSTFSRNTAAGIGGGGADLFIFAFASPGGIGSGTATFGTSTFSNNQGLGTASGGAIIVESLPTTVATTSFISNSAGNSGGAIYVGGGSLTLDGTTPSITFTGNTATTSGSGIGVNVGIDQDPTTNVRTINPTGGVQLKGTNTNLTGHDVFLAFGGAWTNNPGSSLTFGNLVQDSGGNSCGGCANALMAAFKANNTTTTLTGNWTINGGTFVGDTGTVNVAGNLTFNLAAGHGAFTAGSSTVNFNGTGAQNISNNAIFTFNNLTDLNVTQPLTLNNSLAVAGTLNVNGANAILSPVPLAVISGTGTLTGTGTAHVSRIAATPDFLSQYSITNKTLTNLTINYSGAGGQIVNNTPPYSHLVISGTGTKALQGHAAISGNLNIASTLASGTFNFSLGGNWTNTGSFVPGTGTVTFAGTTGTQTLTGNTTFFNLTLNNPGATTNFGTTATTIGNDLTTTAGTMEGGTSTIIFTGVTDNTGSIGGANPKNFHNLQINSPATISNTVGGNITIENNYSNGGTFNQAAALGTVFATDNNGDGLHNFVGGGTTTLGNVAINAGNTVDAGTHSFQVAGSGFAATGTFTGNASIVTFNGVAAQTIGGDGPKNFSGLLVNNATGVQLVNGTGAVDASVSGVLTLNTDLTVAPGAILQQSGTSAGVADVIGTVRRADLGAVERSFGNPNNAITINSGTAPTQLDFNLVKVAPGTFPAVIKVVPRDITLTPTGGSGLSATVKLRYIDPAELAGPGIIESRLVLWKNVAGTWTSQGGTLDAAANFVSLGGISSFSEWAIAEGSDLTLTKANNVSGSAVTGQAWNWTLTASNTGAPATFTAGQTILSDQLPTSNLIYGTPTVQAVSNVTGSGNISCSIVSSDLTCTATGGSVTFDSNIGASNFSVVVSATPQSVGTYQNPRTGGGVAQIDPLNVIGESNESNNSPAANTVTVGKANTTTTITSDDPDPSVVGEPVTVVWTVAVSAPGSLGPALTGNVTVSDGTSQCVAVVSAGQCDVTFTSPGAKSITATYAGDTNYNGSASTPATAHTVQKADTATTITSHLPEPSTPGESVVVQWTLAVVAPGAGTPTGDVTVSDGVDSCTAAAATGQCTVTLNTSGLRTLTASYAGDANFNASLDTESHEVCPGTLVTTAADGGAGSLREVIAGACDGEVVTFDTAGVFATPQTVTLTTGEMPIDKNLTITGPGARVLTIDAAAASRVFAIGAGKTVSLSGMTLTNGTDATGGGAIVNNGAALTVTSMTFSNNAGGSGGAIRSLADGVNASTAIVDSTFTANSGTEGGAIASAGSGGGAATLTLVNSTISGNTATARGGGIFNGLDSALTIVNATITNNRADNDTSDAVNDTGGGLHTLAGPVEVRNTIVAGNFIGGTPSTTADDVAGTIDTASNNVTGVDPILAALANYGGPTDTHAPLNGSPAIDQGAAVNDPISSSPLTVDQRGQPRPIGNQDVADAAGGDGSDIGAVELAAPPFAPDLDAASDLGTSDTDNLTADDTPTFTIGNVVIGATVELLIDGTPAATAVAASTSIQLTSSAASHGPHTFTARQTVAGAASPVSLGLPVTVDIIAPPMPGIDLDAASDTGVSNSDDLTSAASRVFSVTPTEAGTIVELLRDAAAVTATAGTGAAVPLTDTAALTSGQTYVYAARQLDAAGNFAVSANLNVTFDAQAPSVTLASVAPDPTKTSPIPVTVNFSEPVFDFVAGDVVVGNGTLANFSGASASYSFEVTPAGQGSVTVDVAAGVATDAAGNPNTVATPVSRVFDSVLDGPVMTVTPALRTVSVDAIPIVFSEPVTGFDLADLTLTRDGGANLLTGGQTLTTADNQTYSLTNLSGLTGADGAYTLTLVAAASGIVDQATNPLASDASVSWTMDATAPGVTIEQAAGQTDPAVNTSSIDFTATFTEAIAAGTFISADIQLGGTAGATTAVVTQTGPNTYNVAISGFTLPGTVSASIPAGAVTDPAGNASLASTSVDNTVTVEICPLNPEVTSTADSGPGTLRQALANVCTTQPDTITFNLGAGAPHTITLASELSVNTDVTITGPGADQLTISGGGAVRVFHVTAGHVVVISGVTIAGGLGGAPLSGGGAVLNDGSTVTIAASALRGNDAVIGGAVYSRGDAVNATTIIVDSEISGNTGMSGGAIFNEGLSGGTSTLTILNSTISGNSASQEGGGIVNFGTSSPLTIVQSTVTNNTANSDNVGSETGGGIHAVTGPVVLKNSIVAGNVAGTGPGASDDINAAIDALSSHNLIGVDVGLSGIASGSAGNQIGTAALPLDARLGPLANNGGPTQTHALLLGSPALDAGDNTTITGPPFDVTTDQRGAPRVRDAGDADTTQAVDIGAFEAQAAIADIANVSTNEDVPLSFSIDVGDELSTLSFTTASSNLALVPDANISVSGSGPTRTVTITPAANLSGTATITFSVFSLVDDVAVGMTDTFVVTVNGVNDPPTLTDAPDVNLLEDAGLQSVLLAGIGAGADESQVLSVTAVSDNTALIPNPTVDYTSPNTEGTLSYTPVANGNGSAVVTVTVSDGVNTAVDTFTVIVGAVNDPPAISPVGNVAINEDQSTGPIAFTINDVDGLAGLQVTGSSSNTALVPDANVTIAGVGGSQTVTVTPAPNQFGSTVITLILSDGVLQATTTFTVDVNSVEDGPTIDAIPNPAAINEDAGPQTVSLQGISDGGEGGQVLTVTALSNLPALTGPVAVSYTSPSATGLLSYTPVANASGTAIITVDVSDGGATTTRTFTVSVLAVNDPPTLDAVAPVTVGEDAPLQTVALTGISDGGAGESQTIVLTAQSSDTAVVPNPVLSYTSPNPTGSLTFTPVPNASGVATITVTVSDGVDTTTRTFVVTVNTVNDPPTVSTLVSQTTAEDTPVGPLPFTINDADGVAGLSVSASSSNTTLVPTGNLVLGGSGTDRVITVTPAANQHGVAIITVTVTDGTASASSSFTLTVTSVNDTPTISGVADQTLDPGESTGPLAVTVTDPDGTPLTLTGTSSNQAVVPNASILIAGSGASRTVTITPTTTAGSAIVTLTVSDGVLSATTSFTVTVQEPERPGNNPPRISQIADQRVPRGTTSIGPLVFTIGDDETAASGLGVSATSGDDSVVPQSGIVLGGAETVRTISLAIPESANGSTTVTIAVSDGRDSTRMSFQVTVEGPRVPAAPLDLRAVVQGRRVDLSWRIPAEDGVADHAATGFRIEVGSASGRSDVATFTTGVTTTFTIADLAPGEYFIRVRGVNAAGVGNPSNEVQVTITGPPGPDAPQRLRATITESTVQLDWEPPLDGQPVDGYQVEASYLINLTNIGVLNTLAPQLIVSGVGNGTYYARVRGIRAGVLTSASNEIVVIVGPDSCTAAPQTPAGIAIGATGNLVVARWLPPVGPQPVERYILSVGSSPGLSDRGAFEFGAAATSAGALVADGTYVVRVAAANRCGTSAPTTEASITVGGPPPQLPGMPGSVTATVTGSTVRLDWAAPTSGGAPTRYIIEVATAVGVPVATLDTGNPSTTFTYEGAPAGVFVVRVRAANGAGAGAPSPPVIVTVGTP